MGIDEKTVEATFRAMRELLIDVVPEIELRYKAELVHEINMLKRERDALILGHNYMEPALFHTVPDHVGDSLELCRVAERSTAQRIVFCGVRFMAETAKILNPDKRVLLPSRDAGCSLAESITGEDVRRLRAMYPGVPAVCYINTYAEVKAECDACCTSSNAAAVIASFDSDTVIFVPDEYLARNVARETGKRIVVPSLDGGDEVVDVQGVVGWNGRCEVHEKFSTDDVANVRAQFPGVTILAHPECSPAVVEASDFSGSTSAMIRHVRQSDASRFLLLTECAMGDNVAAENPGKEMVRLCSVRCPHMNEITLEQTLESLRADQYEIDVPDALASRAMRAIRRMLDTNQPTTNAIA